MNVIVIGAGVIGTSCADALAGAGHRVHVLDMRSLGRGASHASAGVLAPASGPSALFARALPVWWAVAPNPSAR